MDIRIRPMVASDAEGMVAAVRESVVEVGRYLAWCHADYAMTDAEAWTQSAEPAWQSGLDYRFVIEACSNGAFLGSVGIRRQDKEAAIGNLGYWVRTSITGHGVCSRAARLAVEFAFGEVGLNRVEIIALTDNAASNAVARKIGATFEATLRNKITLNGVALPANAYSIIPSDYAVD